MPVLLDRSGGQHDDGPGVERIAGLITGHLFQKELHRAESYVSLRAPSAGQRASQRELSATAPARPERARRTETTRGAAGSRPAAVVSQSASSGATRRRAAA